LPVQIKDEIQIEQLVTGQWQLIGIYTSNPWYSSCSASRTQINSNKVFENSL